MKISESRCAGSVVLERHVGYWCSGRTVSSKRREGLRWGLCVVCGCRHYDRVLASKTQ